MSRAPISGRAPTSPASTRRGEAPGFGLPRGGVPVAYEAARSLGAAPNVFVIVLEGTLMLVIGGTPVRAAPGTIVRMPAHLPHAVDAIEPARMLLIMLRDV